MLGTLPGNLAPEFGSAMLLGNLISNFEPGLGTLLGNLAWKPFLAICFGPDLPCLRTLPGNLTWEPWEPKVGKLGSLAGTGFWAAPDRLGDLLFLAFGKNYIENQCLLLLLLLLLGCKAGLTKPVAACKVGKISLAPTCKDCDTGDVK